MRLRELATSRVRFGYRRLTVILRREGWRVNPKRIYRLYTEDGLTVRTKLRKKLARRSRTVTQGNAARSEVEHGPS
jgi:putative transposase